MEKCNIFLNKSLRSLRRSTDGDNQRKENWLIYLHFGMHARVVIASSKVEVTFVGSVDESSYITPRLVSIPMMMGTMMMAGMGVGIN